MGTTDMDGEPLLLKAGKLLDQARTRTGLGDFGEESFLEPLERLVDAINREGGLSAIGRQVVPEALIGNLVNRLEVESWYARHPEIEDQQIVAPLFGIGLPRTGSTALGFMLAQDPNLRVVREWEANRPCPPPETATENSDPRIAAAQVAADALEGLVPELRKMLPRDVRGPQECYVLFMFSFASTGYEAMANIPSYNEWLLSPGFDMGPAYRYHRRVLKLLQWRCPPRRWSLRAPAHMFAMEALDAVYPDAQFVMTHRDPVKTLPSYCSLMYRARQPFLDCQQPEALGKAQERYWATALGRLMAFRDRIGETRFFDVSHRRQSADPAEQIRTLYDKLGWRFDAALETRIRQWQDTNPKGAHKAAPGFFGLDPEEIAQRYRFYTDRFAALL